MATKNSEFFSFNFSCTLQMGNNLTRKVTGGVCQRLKTPALAPAAKSRCIFVECIISTHLLVHTDGMQNILDRKKTKEGNFWYLISKEWPLEVK